MYHDYEDTEMVVWADLSLIVDNFCSIGGCKVLDFPSYMIIQSYRIIPSCKLLNFEKFAILQNYSIL